MLAARAVNNVRRLYLNLVYKTIPYKRTRWAFTLLLSLIYLYHTLGMSYYIITYIIGFYILQLLVNYFTPKGLDEQEEDEEIHVPDAFDESLYNFGLQQDCVAPPSKPVEQKTACVMEQVLSHKTQDDERHPMAHSLSEIEIWERVNYAFLMGLVCSSFKMLEIDVFWPLLVVYFVILLCYTIRKIIRQMVKHNYTFKDFAKQ